MTSVTPVLSRLSAPAVPLTVDPPHSLEERLRAIRERCRLLADLFSLQAEANLLACQVELSADACHALMELCRTAADDLEALAHALPGSIANWYPGSDDDGRP